MPPSGPLTRLLLIPFDASATQFTTEVQGTVIWATVIQPYENQDFRTRLGVPNDEILFCFAVSNPLGWEDYSFIMYGTFADTIPNAATAPLFSICVKTDPEKAGEDIPLVARFRMVACPGTPVWIEARWNPTEGETLALKGATNDMKKVNIDKAYNGIRLLRTIEALGGRPPDMDEETFRQNYWDTYQKLLDQVRRDGGRLPTKQQVAAEMLMHRRTLTRTLNRYHLSWPPLSPR